MRFLILAQTAKTKATQWDVVLWVAVLIVVAFVGGLAMLWFRKRLLSKDHPASEGSLMDRLRGMLERGEITQAEFDATRRAMVNRIARQPGSGEVAPKVPQATSSRPHSKRRTPDDQGQGPSA